MGMFRRIFLFLLVNFLVIIMISFILNLLNVRPYIEETGLNYNSLILFCLIWGMGGAFISLSLSRVMAKWILKVKVIDPSTQDQEEKKLLQKVETLAKKASIPMPEVGIYFSKEVNAFATGPTQKRSLVALSSGLLEKLSQEEIEGVLAHEISHIANGDMVTMTLLQGIINAFVMFLSRILAFALSRTGKNERSSVSLGSYMVFVFVFEVIFMVLGSLVIAAYSRFREYRADKGGAFLAGKTPMVHALQSLRVLQQIKDKKAEVPALQAFKISHQSKGGLTALFATHPPLEKRIERLQNEA